jgi:hypothetical protein
MSLINGRLWEDKSEKGAPLPEGASNGPLLSALLLFALPVNVAFPLFMRTNTFCRHIERELWKNIKRRHIHDFAPVRARNN